MLAAGTYLVPTLSALRNIVDNAGKGIPPYAVEKAERAADQHRASVKMFYDAGGKIAMGTDSGTPFNIHGENARELRFMVDVGMEPADALTAATSHGADLNQLPNRGRIADGMVADLLMVSGNPLEDIDAVADKANHRTVVKGGVVVAGGLAANLPVG